MRTFPILLLAAAVSILAFDAGCDDDPPQLSHDAGPSGGPPRFRRDVNPLLQTWCATSPCHGLPENDLGILLQTATPDAVYAVLMTDSRMAPGVKFVVPGNVDQSFLMAKMDGTQATFTAKCPSVKDCGQVMPPTGKLKDDLRKTVRDWIAAGAKND